MINLWRFFGDNELKSKVQSNIREEMVKLLRAGAKAEEFNVMAKILQESESGLDGCKIVWNSENGIMMAALTLLAFIDNRQMEKLNVQDFARAILSNYIDNTGL